MWIIVLGFVVTTLLLVWLLFGYVVWLRFVGDGRRRAGVAPPTSFPAISVVVPCLNEKEMIVEKYDDLVGCDYPRDKVEIVFADGGSTDGTVEHLEELARKDERIRVVACPAKGKTGQLNDVLPMLGGRYVIVTDADARLAPDALTWMVAEFEADPNVAVVGAYTTPRGGLAVERCYWRTQNRIRCLESSVSHVSMVIACCYAFKRELLSRFPHDVIADDVYVAVLANTLGHHTVYSTKALVEELRTPVTLPEFFRHKFRKSNAVFRELLRFSYRLPETDGRWKSILSTRIVQQLLLPWGTLMWLLSAAALVNLGQYDVPCLGVALLLVALLVTRKATMAVELPGPVERSSILTAALAYLYTMAILCATGLTYLSFRQSSCFTRLTGTTRSMAREKVETRTANATRPPTVPTLAGGEASFGVLE